MSDDLLNPECANVCFAFLKIEQISVGEVICQSMLLSAIIWTLAGTCFQFLFTYTMEKFCDTIS